MSRLILTAGMLLFAGTASQASGETLQDALSLAYRSNPTLRGQRAAQRGIDETAVQARTGWRPLVTARLDGGYSRGPFDQADLAAGTVESNAAEAAVTVTQPLYTGGRVTNAVRAADARVQAGQQGLRLVEAQTFQAVIQSYMDVLRDQDILTVRRADLTTLERAVAETTSRFKLGAQVTRTDVAQAEAQRDGARASLADADAQLAASRAGYAAVVGAPPGTLLQPATLPDLPVTLEVALSRADAAEPTLQQSRLTAAASEADVTTARSAYLPTIGLQAEFGYIGPAAPFRNQSYDREVTGLVTLTQPLVTGGMTASQVRQARDRNEADRQAVDTASRQARQAVLTAWSAFRAGMTATQANQDQVRSAATSLRGYQLEYADGLRATLDVLIADENLRAAQVALAQSRHDTILAEAALLAETGRLEARTLLRGEPIYDPQVALRRVRRIGAVPWQGVIATLDRLGIR